MKTSLLFLLIPVISSTASVCTPCVNPEDSFRFLDKPVDLPGLNFPGLTCGTLQQGLPLFLAENDPRCNLVHQIGTYCGCPIQENACGFCDGYDRVAGVSDFVELEGTLYSGTCELANSYLQSLPKDSDECLEKTERWAETCGCGMDSESGDAGGSVDTVQADPDDELPPSEDAPPNANEKCGLCRHGVIGFPGKDLSHFLIQEASTRYDSLAALGNLTYLSCFMADALLQNGALPEFCSSERNRFIGGICGCPPIENECDFCPTKDITKPDDILEVAGFRVGFDTTCEDVDLALGLLDRSEFYCWSAKELAHQCGCNKGVAWYYGAATVVKHAVLAWVPRVSGVLSLLGSGYIIQDIFRWYRRTHSITTYHMLMLGMSLFDLSSSIAWMFSTLPVPQNDWVGALGVCKLASYSFPSDIAIDWYPLIFLPCFKDGARGNEATCKTQGFFLELGFVGSSTFNVSLTFFYLLSIVYNYPDFKTTALRKYLLGVPTILALALASAGVPHYQSDVIGCLISNPFTQESNSGTWRYFIIFSILPIALATSISFVALSGNVAGRQNVGDFRALQQRKVSRLQRDPDTLWDRTWSGILDRGHLTEGIVPTTKEH
jgi:hypothetical protein